MKGYLKNLLFYAAILIVVVLLLYFLFGNGSEKPLYYELVTYFRNIGTDEEARHRQCRHATAHQLCGSLLL